MVVVLVGLFVFYETHHGVAYRSLATLRAAQHVQHVQPPALPANFTSLTGPDQLVILINDERVARGLAPGLVSFSHQRLLTAALAAGRDPVPVRNVPGVTSVDTIWGWSSIDGGSSPTLTAAALEYIMYSWVYHDGWLGSLAATSNIDCTSPIANGCNGHRDAILSPDVPGATLVIIPGVAAAANGPNPGTSAVAELIWTNDPSQFNPTAPVT